MKNLKSDVRDFINSNLVVFDEELLFSDEDNLFEKGFVNSLFAMKLLSYIEEHHHVEVSDDELNLSNFSSVNNIVDLIKRKTLV